jgi:hypothetical protein
MDDQILLIRSIADTVARLGRLIQQLANLEPHPSRPPALVNGGPNSSVPVKATADKPPTEPAVIAKTRSVSMINMPELNLSAKDLGLDCSSSSSSSSSDSTVCKSPVKIPKTQNRKADIMRVQFSKKVEPVRFPERTDRAGRDHSGHTALIRQVTAERLEPTKENVNLRTARCEVCHYRDGRHASSCRKRSSRLIDSKRH